MFGMAPSESLREVQRFSALVEALHAVVYFADEAAHAYAGLGLRGYWRGYFASRLAALGEVGPEVATAVCGGFAPRFVALAVPEVWAVASPARVLEAREGAAVAVLRRVFTGDEELGGAADALERMVRGLDLSGRPLAAAHASLPVPRDPAALLWHCCTVLREHRGDGHLAAVTAAGLSWPVPHLLAAERLDSRQREYRGWTELEWAAAGSVAAGLPLGLVEELELATDQAAVAGGVSPDGRVIGLLQPLALAVAAGGLLPFPNAMGLRQSMLLQ